MKEKLTGSERGIRERMLKCECGVVGQIFISNGEFSVGHFCKSAQSWTMRRLQQIDHKDLMDFYLKLHHMGPG